MKIFPYEHFEIQMSNSKNEIVRTMRENTDPNRPSIFRAAGGKPFWGKVWDDGFGIIPTVTYRNTFVPEISGAITEQENGAAVAVVMRLNSAVKTFMTFGWCFARLICCSALS